MPMSAHTPISFLKGGGAADFSASCVKLLSDVGFSPEDFGTHSQLNERRAQERDASERRIAELEQAVEGQGGTPTEQQAAELQAERERLDGLYGQEAAHLGQNSAKQRERGNPCSNMVDGHSDGDYPCVMIEGPAMRMREGRLLIDDSTEHGRMSLMEVQQARADGRVPDRTTNAESRQDARPPRNPNSVYPAAAMDADERARAAALCADRGSNPGASSTLDAGAIPETPSTKQTEAIARYEAALANRENETDPSPSEIDGETAAECIDTYRKMGEVAMRQKCKDEVEANARNAGTPEQRAEAREAADEARARQEAAEAPLRAAEQELETANRSFGQYDSDSNPRSQPDHPTHAEWQRERDAAEERVRVAREARDQAQTARDRVVRREAATIGRSSAMENANCLARQGRRLRNGEGVREDGRVPSGTARTLPRQDAGGEVDDETAED